MISPSQPPRLPPPGPTWAPEPAALDDTADLPIIGDEARPLLLTSPPPAEADDADADADDATVEAFAFDTPGKDERGRPVAGEGDAGLAFPRLPDRLPPVEDAELEDECKRVARATRPVGDGARFRAEVGPGCSSPAPECLATAPARIAALIDKKWSPRGGRSFHANRQRHAPLFHAITPNILLLLLLLHRPTRQGLPRLLHRGGFNRYQMVLGLDAHCPFHCEVKKQPNEGVLTLKTTPDNTVIRTKISEGTTTKERVTKA